jgi:hypothetical protein
MQLGTSTGGIVARLLDPRLIAIPELFIEARRAARFLSPQLL